MINNQVLCIRQNDGKVPVFFSQIYTLYYTTCMFCFRMHAAYIMLSLKELQLFGVVQISFCPCNNSI